MALSGPITLSRDDVAKRVRERKYKDFGQDLIDWRGAMDIETAVRLVRKAGVDFNGATLRGWEYGWTGAPDPIRLLVLARVYGRSMDDVLSALAKARGLKAPPITKASDLLGQDRTIERTLQPGASDATATPDRRAERQRHQAFVRKVQDAARRLASIATALGTETEKAQNAIARSGRGARKTG